MRLTHLFTISAAVVALATACVDRSEVSESVTGGVSSTGDGVPADGSAAAKLTITVLQNGTPVEGANVRVLSNGQSTITQPSPTDANGRTNATARSTTVSVQTFSAIATSSDVTAQLPQTATVNFIATAPSTTRGVTSHIVATPNSVIADGVSTIALKTTVLDVNGKPVVGAAVTLSADGNRNTLTPTSGTTDASGALNANLTSTLAQNENIIATVGSVTAQARVAFKPGPPSQTQSTFIANPNNITADNVSVSTLILCLQDAQGNPAPNQPTTLAVAGTGYTLTPVTMGGVTDAKGLFVETLASSQAGTKVATATSGSITQQANVVFVAGVPSGSNSVIVASPNSVTTDNNTTTTLTVTVVDAALNPVPNVIINLSGDGSQNTFAPPNGVTNSSGTFTATLYSPFAQNENIIATGSNFSAQTRVTFIAGAPATSKSTLSAAPTSVSADGVSTTLLTFTVKDAQGNLVPSAAATYTSNGNSNTFPQGNTGSTNSVGVFTATMSSTKAQAKTVTGAAAAATKTASVTFTPGLPNNANSTIAVAPTSVSTDTGNHANITVTLKDAFGNSVTDGTTVTFGGTGINNTFTPPSTTTTSGVATGTVAATLAQNENITASGTGYSLFVPVTFVAGSPNSTMSRIVVTPTTLTADNTTQSTIVVTLKDAFGNLAQPTLITMGTTGGNDTFTPPTATSTNGNSTFLMRSKTAQVKFITATEATAIESANITFTAAAPSQPQSTMVINGSPALANNANFANVAVTLRDAYGNLVTNWPFTLSATNTAFPQLTKTAVTNSVGVFTYALASQFAGPKKIFARTGAVLLSGAVTFSQPTPYCYANAKGAFYAAPPMWLGLTAATHYMTSTDLNGDGYMDLVETDPGNNTVAVGLGAGNGRFQPVVSYPVGNNPTMAATCRLNNDAYPDVVVVNTNDGTVTAFLGSSTGALTVTPGSPVTVSGANMGNGSIQCIDVTGDTLPDAIVSSYSAKRFYVLPGDGTGSFGTIKTQNVTSPPYFFTMGDVTQDGNTDIVYVDNANHVLIGIAKGGGLFNAPNGKNIGLGTVPVAAALADLDGKNGIDIVTVNSGTSNASVLLNDGAGTYATSTFVTVNASNPTSLWLADLNGDSNVEIIVGSVADNNITITPGQGNATFGTPKAYAIGSAPGAISTGKVNSDASVDVVVAIGGNLEGGAQALFGKGDGTVSDYTVYPAGPSPSGLATADVNGDGWPDLVAASNGEVDVFLNTGVGGTFSPYVSYTAGLSGLQAVSINLADLDADGDLDIVASITAVSGGGILTMFNAGNGTFYGGVEYATPSGNDWGAAVADFNNDGSADVATGNRGSNNVWVALGSPTGTLGTPYSVAVGPAGGHPAELVAGDINGDSNQDLVVAVFDGDVVGVLIGKGDGTFVNQGNYTTLSNSGGLGGVALADLNLDGNSDVMVTETFGYSASTMLGNGTGVFTGKWTDPGNDDFPYAVTAADLNGDGVPDMVVSGHYQHALFVHMGLGDGTLSTSIIYPSGHGPYYIALADFDHDGHMDIASVDQDDSTLDVRLWSSCP